jgi:hypothetical protein
LWASGIKCRFADSEDVPVRGHHRKVTGSIGGLCLGQFAERCDATQHSIAPDQRQIRGNHEDDRRKDEGGLRNIRYVTPPLPPVAQSRYCRVFTLNVAHDFGAADTAW